MEKETQPTDYIAILADLKAKRAALDAAIVGIEAAHATGALGALGVATGDSLSVKDSVGVSLGVASALPRGALLGKPAPEAIKLYLSSARKKQTNKEIVEALKQGGVESTSKNYDSFVNSALFRLKNAGEVLRFDDGWGLSEWYPDSFKNRVSQEKPKSRKKGKAKVKPVIQRTAPSSTPPKKASASDIEALLQANRPRAFSMAEIAHLLGTGSSGMQLTLGRLAKAGKAERCEDRKYRAPKPVQDMPTAKAS